MSVIYLNNVRLPTNSNHDLKEILNSYNYIYELALTSNLPEISSCEHLYIHRLILSSINMSIIKKFKEVKYIILIGNYKLCLNIDGDYKIYVNNNTYQYDDPRICGITNYEKIHLYQHITKITLTSKTISDYVISDQVTELELNVRCQNYNDIIRVLRLDYKTVNIHIMDKVGLSKNLKNMTNLIYNIKAKNISLTCAYLSTEQIKILLNKPDIKSLHLNFRQYYTISKIDLSDNYTILYFTIYNLSHIDQDIYNRNMELYKIHKNRQIKSARN